jgi:hypothetical protein
MTWGRALPVLVGSLIFDAAGAFFAFFWIIGPALGFGICAVTGQSTVGSLGGVTETICVGAAAAASYLLAGAFEAFGAVMAALVSYMGWGAATLYLLLTNARIYKKNSDHILWSLGGLVIDGVPFVNALPALTATMYKLYRTQIHKERAELEAYIRAKALLEAQTQQETWAQAAQEQQLSESEDANALESSEIQQENSSATKETASSPVEDEMRNEKERMASSADSELTPIIGGTWSGFYTRAGEPNVHWGTLDRIGTHLHVNYRDVRALVQRNSFVGRKLAIAVRESTGRNSYLFPVEHVQAEFRRAPHYDSRSEIHDTDREVA